MANTYSCDPRQPRGVNMCTEREHFKPLNMAYILFNLTSTLTQPTILFIFLSSVLPGTGSKKDGGGGGSLKCLKMLLKFIFRG